MAIKKLPLISIALVAAGLVLILYADPVITQTGEPAINGPGGGSHIFNGTMRSSGPGANITRTVQPGNTFGGGNGELYTLLGVALIGAGLVVNAIEAAAKPTTGSGPQAVA